MKKRIFGKKLSRAGGSRRALYRGLVRALTLHGSIKTTRAKAKSVQPFVDRLVKIAKKNNLVAKRRVYAMLGNDREVSEKLFSVVAKAFDDRGSGFTKLTNLPRRRGDRAETVIFEWSKQIETSDKKQASGKDKEKGSDKSSTSRATKKDTKTKTKK